MTVSRGSVLGKLTISLVASSFSVLSVRQPESLPRLSGFIQRPCSSRPRQNRRRLLNFRVQRCSSEMGSSVDLRESGPRLRGEEAGLEHFQQNNLVMGTEASEGLSRVDTIRGGSVVSSLSVPSSLPEVLQRGDQRESRLCQRPKREIADLLGSVVQIWSDNAAPNFAQPWLLQRQQRVCSSGFLIEGGKILTTARTVEHSRLITVRRHGQARRFKARLEVASPDCDLALLSVEDAEEGGAFWREAEGLKFGGLPALRERVVAAGCALGNSVSLTSGCLARVLTLSYGSAIDGSGEAPSLLTGQMDAEIPCGNSGGPVIDAETLRVVGVCLPVTASEKNKLGLFVPAPVVLRFLKTVRKYKRPVEFARLGVKFQRLENRSMRRFLGVDACEGEGRRRSGILVLQAQNSGRPMQSSAFAPSSSSSSSSLATLQAGGQRNDSNKEKEKEMALQMAEAQGRALVEAHSHSYVAAAIQEERERETAASASASLLSSWASLSPHSPLATTNAVHEQPLELTLQICGGGGGKGETGTTKEKDDKEETVCVKPKAPPSQSDMLTLQMTELTEKEKAKEEIETLRPGDVILKVDSHWVADDGTTQLRGKERCPLSALVALRVPGDTVNALVWRDGEAVKMKVRLSDPRLLSSTEGKGTASASQSAEGWNERPRFFVFAGLVFTPLTANYLRDEFGRRFRETAPQPLLLRLRELAGLQAPAGGSNRFPSPNWLANGVGGKEGEVGTSAVQQQESGPWGEGLGGEFGSSLSPKQLPSPGNGGSQTVSLKSPREAVVLSQILASTATIGYEDISNVELISIDGDRVESFSQVMEKLQNILKEAEATEAGVETPQRKKGSCGGCTSCSCGRREEASSLSAAGKGNSSFVRFEFANQKLVVLEKAEILKAHREVVETFRLPQQH
mmetsp:Transcript_41730/g.82374  ORF Transcript_41730/g.82374 Transcript_41730/m.82374 type:complete len:911 (-) Transcript_41730:2422-5154(-)